MPQQIDDPAIPQETIIKNSTTWAIGQIIMGVVLVVVCTWFFVQKAVIQKQSLLQAVFLATGVMSAIRGVRNFNDQDPKIILNNDGIEMGNAVFYNWDKISNERVRWVLYGRYWRTRFSYECPDGEMKINLTDLNVSWFKMKKLLRIYRNRYNEQHGIYNVAV
jgi:hypothetical protein